MVRDRREDLLQVADAFFHGLEQAAEAFFQRLEYASRADGQRPHAKRPVGQSDILSDILTLIQAVPEEEKDGHHAWSEEQRAYARSLYAGLGDFLVKEWEQYRQSMRASLTP